MQSLQPVQIVAGRAHETVHLIDWERPDKNDFALAEEVTLKGGYQRRPDIVLYVNGIAIAVIELKRSSVELADGNDHTCDAVIYVVFKARGSIKPASLYRSRSRSEPLHRSIISKTVKALRRDYGSTA